MTQLDPKWLNLTLLDQTHTQPAKALWGIPSTQSGIIMACSSTENILSRSTSQNYKIFNPLAWATNMGCSHKVSSIGGGNWLPLLKCCSSRTLLIWCFLLNCSGKIEVTEVLEFSKHRSLTGIKFSLRPQSFWKLEALKLLFNIIGPRYLLYFNKLWIVIFVRL